MEGKSLGGNNVLREKKGKVVWKWLRLCFTYTILIIGGIGAFLPFLWMLSTSLKESGEIFLFPPRWLPHPIVWRNYYDMWTLIPFARFFLNSVFISGTVTFGHVISCSLAAFAFARLNFRGRDLLFLAYLGTMMIPGQVIMIPTFILMKFLNWIDTYYALIVPGLFGAAFGTFLLRQFFLTIPKELEDAARIDGCSFLGIYYKIILPLSKPALAVLAIFIFMATWNNFLWPLILIDTMEKMPITLALSIFQGFYTTEWNLLMAGTIVSLLPILIAFIIGQKYFIQGITLTGIKG